MLISHWNEAATVRKLSKKTDEAKMINADKNQDLSAFSVATVCLQDSRKQEETVCELEQALEHLEQEYNRF